LLNSLAVKVLSEQHAKTFRAANCHWSAAIMNGGGLLFLTGGVISF
jgi:hypothetical protein